MTGSLSPRPENLNRPFWSVLIFFKRGERIGQSIARCAWPIRRRTINNHSKTDIVNRVFVYGWVIVCQGGFRPDQRVQTARQERFFFCFPILTKSSRVVFLKSAIFNLFSNFLMSNFNGFCMVLYGSETKNWRFFLTTQHRIQIYFFTCFWNDIWCRSEIKFLPL